MDADLMPAPPLRHHHYGVSVANLDRSIAWYASSLGFEIERTFRLRDPPARAAMLKRDGLRVELFEVEGAGALPGERREPHADLRIQGNKHPAFAIDSLQAFMSWVRASELDLAFVVPGHLGCACFIRDPDGNLIEFVERRLEP